MKYLHLTLTLAALAALATCEPPVSKRPLVFHNWPHKSAKQQLLGRTVGGKQRTLVVQIRSDQPGQLVLKGRPGHGHAHPHLHHGSNFHSRPVGRPIKLTGPVYLKGGSMHSKPMLRKPLKFKLPSSKPKSKPSLTYDKPFKYELPTTTVSSYAHLAEVQKLPLETHANFISDHFAPIHTIPAPNLAALHDNHIHHDDQPPQPQPYHQSQNQYRVTEDHTNDQTILDPFSGSQKLFAPDPDPSLPTVKIRPAVEAFNQPSNGKPLPADVQSNYLPPAAQPLVQIVGAHQQQSSNQAPPEIYPIQFGQQAQLQPFLTSNVAAIQASPISLYNPSYLVAQSNNLYTQHQQQLFKPVANVVEAGYVDADLTQEVASNGQILQAAKDPHNNIHPVLDAAPQFAALIAAPALGEEQQAFEVTAPFRLANVAASSTGPEGGFVVSNFFGNAQDSSQLLQAYAEEEAQRQQLEAEQANLELQKQKHFHQLQLQQEQQHLQQIQQEHEEQQLLLQQQQQNHLLELQQQQQQNHLLELQQQQQHQQLRQPQHLQQQQADPAAAAFEEHQRLVQQQLGETPLRIFVPDDETRIQKRSDNLKKGTVEDADARELSSHEDSFEVSSSVEVSSDGQKDDDGRQGARNE